MSQDERDFSDDETEECKKRRLTAKGRAAKYVAAKASSSKAGRSLIQKACGDDGTALIDIFFDLMQSFSKKFPEHQMDAKEMFKCLFKVVVKCAVFLDNGLLTENEFNEVSIAAATFAFCLLDMCELPMVYCEVGKLQELLTTIEQGIATLLEPLVTGKSIQRLSYVRKHLRAEFFEFLLKDDDAAMFRAEVGSRILKVLESRNIPRPAQEQLETSKVG